MRKGIKILVKLISTLVLLSIFLPISITLLLSVDSIQNFVVDKATSFASERLGTTVSIDRIDLDLFSKLRVRGFYVEDYEGDTLLYVSDVRARLNGLNIPRDGLHLSDAKIKDSKLCLREMASGELNIRPIIQKLTRPNGKGNFRLYIDDIDAENIQFTYERLQHRNPEYGVDYGDMDVRNICGRVNNLSVIKGVVHLDMDGISAYEKSGFELASLCGHLHVGKGVINFNDIVIDTEKSHLVLPSVSLLGENWLSYKRYIEEVRMTGEVIDGWLSTDDVGYFAPGLRRWKTVVSDVDVAFDGVVRDFVANVRSLSLGKSSSIVADAHIVGLPDWRNSLFEVDVKQLYATSNDVLPTLRNIPKNGLPQRVEQIIRDARWLNADFEFEGMLTKFAVDGTMTSGVGSVDVDADIEIGDNGLYQVAGDVTTRNLDVGVLANFEKLHTLDTHVVADVAIGGGADPKFDVEAEVAGIGFGSYYYRDINLMGKGTDKSYYAELHSADENLMLDIYALADMSADVPHYEAAIDIKRADLHALGYNKRDTISVISAAIGAQASGGSIDELIGELSGAQLRYDYPGATLESDLVLAEIHGGEDMKYLGLQSDFFDMEYKSMSGYNKIVEYLYNSLKTYVPLLYEDGDEGALAMQGNKNFYNDYAVMEIRAKEGINELLAVIDPKLIVAPDTKASLMLSPAANSLSLNLRSEALEYAGLIMADTKVEVNNDNDSLALWVNSEAVYMGSRMLMPGFSAAGGARENRITLAAGFGSPADTLSGMLGMSAKFRRDEQSRRRSIHINITPSYLANKAQLWRLYARGIDIDSSRINVHNLVIVHDSQRLVVNGVASRSREDSIRLTLDNFDLSPLSALVARWGYSVAARSNGYATVKSALDHPEIEARIELDDIRVNQFKAPPQVITSQWDFELNQARVIISDRERGDTAIRGYYRPRGNKYFAKATMKNMHLGLISPFLRGIVSDIEGRADIDVQIIGEGRKATLSGSAFVDSIGATVDYLKTRYFAPHGDLRVEANHIYADRIPLYDKEGNKGHYSMDLNLEHLSNVGYNISIDADKMLVLDTKAQDNDLFYGHVYASGLATFKGDKRGMKMDIEATSADNSTFFMPLMGKEDVSYADFVRFRKPEIQVEDTTAFLRRRMMAYERKYRPVNVSAGVMDIDMTFNVLPNTDIQLVIDPTLGDIIRGRGNGQLALHIVPKSNIFEMRGDYYITEGNYLFTLQNILHKKFKVEPGSSIHWTGDSLGATLDIDAIYSTKASLKPLIGNSMRGVDVSRAVPVDCYIKLTDELMHPQVEFDIEVPNVAPEIQGIVQSALNDQQSIATHMFWLLAANSFSTEDSGAMGATFSTTTGFEMLSNQLSNWLSGEDYNIILRYRPRTELSGDEVDFGFSKSLLNDRLIIEVEGGYLSDASIQAAEKASNFVGEAFITWLIDDEGTFRFRGFTQTIDRYGENQGMQESGIGLYYGESFNTFKELGESVKSKFVNEERRQKRRARKAKRAAERNGDVDEAPEKVESLPKIEVDFVFEDDETFDMEEVDAVEESETTKKIIE